MFFAQLWGDFFIIFGVLFIISGQLGKTIEMTDTWNLVVMNEF